MPKAIRTIVYIVAVLAGTFLLLFFQSPNINVIWTSVAGIALIIIGTLIRPETFERKGATLWRYFGALTGVFSGILFLRVVNTNSEWAGIGMNLTGMVIMIFSLLLIKDDPERKKMKDIIPSDKLRFLLYPSWLCLLVQFFKQGGFMGFMMAAFIISVCIYMIFDEFFPKDPITNPVS